MKALVKSAVNLLVLVSILFSSFAVPFYAPIVQAQQTQSEFEAQVTAELTTYAQTHTQAELEAEVNRRLDEAEWSAYEAPDDMMSIANLINPPQLLDIPKSPFSTYSNQHDRLDCIGIRTEACREDYNRDLFLATGAGLGILAGCTGITAGLGFIGCGVAALGVQQAGIQAARSGRRACNFRAQQDCTDAYR